MRGLDTLLKAIPRRSHETGKQIVREPVVSLGQTIERRNRRSEDSQMSRDAAARYSEGGRACNHGRERMVLRDHAERSAQCGD